MFQFQRLNVVGMGIFNKADALVLKDDDRVRHLQSVGLKAVGGGMFLLGLYVASPQWLRALWQLPFGGKL